MAARIGRRFRRHSTGDESSCASRGRTELQGGHGRDEHSLRCDTRVGHDANTLHGQVCVLAHNTRRLKVDRRSPSVGVDLSIFNVCTKRWRTGTDVAVTSSTMGDGVVHLRPVALVIPHDCGGWCISLSPHRVVIIQVRASVDKNSHRRFLLCSYAKKISHKY